MAGRRAATPSLTRARVAVPIALFGLTLACFGRAVSNGFIDFDDPTYVTDNARVERGLTGGALWWDLTTFHASNWHPLTWLSLQLDAQLHGLDPGVFHLSSVLLHAASAVVLLLALWRMTGALWRSALVAALFAWHPLHVESVAWVAERKDVLSGLFWMLCLWAYALYAERPSLLRYLGVLLLYALGLAAKPMLVTLPCVLLLLDYWPLARFRGSQLGEKELRFSGHSPKGRLPLRSLLLEKLPLIILSAVSCLLTWRAQHAGAAVMSLERASATVRLENALLSYGVYLWNTFWPVHLAVFHPLNRDAVPAAALAAALALCAAITVTALFLRRSRPYVLVGWLWYVGTLVPVIGLVQVGSQARADRYTYIPLIGIFLIVSWGLADLAQYLQRRLAAIAVAAAALAGCVVLTWVQIGFWQDSARLWRHALEVNPVNPRAHASLAAALAVEGKGKLNEAVTHYLAAVNQSPDLRHERLELARLLAKLGKDSEAVSHYETAIRAGPDSAAIENAMGASLSRMGHEAAAAAHYEQALRLDPGYYPAHFNLGLVLDRQDRLAEAAGHYSEALRLESHYEAAAFGLAGIVWKVATGAAPQNAVDSSAAVRFGETASAALADRDPLVLEALAAAYAHAGDYAHAVPTAERALALTADPRQLSAARRRLELYRHHEPCRDATAAP